MPVTTRLGAAEPESRLDASHRWRRASAVVLLCGAATLSASACGGSSSADKGTPSNSGGSTAGDSNAVAGHTTTGGSATGATGGNAPITGDAGKAGSDVSSDGGAMPVDSGGAGAMGDGGATTSPPDQPTLGGDCAPPGSLACAGPHQKLTLVCSAGKTWETNQTCSSGQYCSSPPGPDLGICKAPSADCASRQPGEAFCGGTSTKDAMKCDADGIDAGLVEHCAERCVDGKCEGATPCPENIIYSCDPRCPGSNPKAPACFALCPTIPGGLSPLLPIDVYQGPATFAVPLPAVPADAEPCSCSRAGGAIRGIAFRLPPAPRDFAWRLKYSTAWTLHYFVNDVPYGDREYDCFGFWAPTSKQAPGCAIVAAGLSGTIDVEVWLSANAAIYEPTSLQLELLAAKDAACQ